MPILPNDTRRGKGDKMIKSNIRGWPIIYVNKKWIYVDTKRAIKKNRPCKRCHQPPTANGHDTCLGEISNTISACCGHGAEKGFIIRKEK